MGLSDIFQKQNVMRRVCYSLTPIFIYSIFLYGIAPIYQVVISFFVGILTEYIFERHRNKKTSEAVLVTCYLYGLSLPPYLPIWMNVVGIFIAVFIAKCVFGGFGRNVYNPAITGRAFIYLAFPTALTTQYWLSISPLAQSFADVMAVTDAGAVDAVSIATPLVLLQQEGTITPLLHLFFGLRAGSMGEGAIFLILIAAIYLIYTKTADWRLMVSTVLGGTGLLVLLYVVGAIPHFNTAMNGSEGVRLILANLMSGSFLYMAVFMTTDPISGPNSKVAKWYYGIIIGTTTIIIRIYSGFPEGVSFGIMVGNTFACLLDEVVNSRIARKKAKTAALTTSLSIPLSSSTSSEKKERQ